MPKIVETDLCVIGAGSAGLSVAAGASQMGARTVLIEKGEMGGDCLNYGCVPSKALLAAGKMAKLARRAAEFGVEYAAPSIDFARVHRHVHEVIAAIAPNDSVERFEGLGVRVIKSAARFTGPGEIEAGEYRVRARRFVIATGSYPLVPPIEGLDGVTYLTNETVFDLKERPERLIVLGGGPIGCELGQAFAHLGSRVAIVEMASILPKDDPELVAILRARFQADGIEIHEGAKVVAVEPETKRLAVVVENNGERQRITGSHLLIAAGRRPSVKELGLEAAGVTFDAKGVNVDARLRTSNRRIFAAGDVAGGYQFTHMAGYHAGIVIRNALFRLPAKVDNRAVPWVTYSAPELAQVGKTEAMARDSGEEISILRWPYAENDRAQSERETDGLIKLVIDRGDRIIGASILGANAGELIHLWVLAVSKRMKVGEIAQMIAPYPTLGEIGKRAAGSYFTPKLFSERTRKLVRFLLRLP